MKKILNTLTLASTLLLASAAMASDAFFEVGKSYLVIPRIDVVIKGTVTQVTDQEVVFKDHYELTTSKPGGSYKSTAIKEYLNSKDKASLLERTSLTDTPISYSRANITAIELDE